MKLRPFESWRVRRTHVGSTRLNVVKTFPLFEARGWGTYKLRAPLTIQSVNATIPALLRLSEHVSAESDLERRLVRALDGDETPDQVRLRSLFDEYGSDKASEHDYYRVYADLLRDLRMPTKILEIGLGTNNADVVSTMGPGGRPGASLRAFRDFCPEATVYGADVDSRILFTEDRIQTHFVDQSDPGLLDRLGESVGVDFDLMIDDGLHAPHANLHSLHFFLNRLRVGGYAVIEDIYEKAVPVWQLVLALLPARFDAALIPTRAAHMFVVRRDE